MLHRASATASPPMIDFRWGNDSQCASIVFLMNCLPIRLSKQTKRIERGQAGNFPQWL